LSALWLAALACGGGDGSSVAPLPEPPPPPPPPAMPTAPVGPLRAGVTVTDAAGYVEYTPGTAPLVLIAPHGGTQSPAILADRNCSGCTTVNDLNTQELARAIAMAFAARTGHAPHLVVNRLHRRKFDGNRDLGEAVGSNRMLDTTWLWFHAALDSARARVTAQQGRGLVIDLHGHAHEVPRLELGYLIDDAELRLSNSALDAAGALSRSSVARLATDSRVTADRGAGILRGSNSLGALLVAAGYASVPSPADPAPLAGQAYFTGGYNTQRHGSLSGGTLDAIQIEAHLNGVRDTEASRTRFAAALAEALQQYLVRHYGWTPAP
jgi:N-formylglutamate amidohydrolase